MHALHAFIKTAQDIAWEDHERQVLDSALARLPRSYVEKIASGQVKLAFGCDDPEDVSKYLRQFEGTPLLAQAVELEKQEIALDQQQAQKDQLREAQREMLQDDNIWSQRKQLRLAKKMLVLQLVEQQLMAGQGGPPPPPQMQVPPEEGGGAPPPDAAAAGGAPPPDAAGPPKMAAMLEMFEARVPQGTQESKKEAANWESVGRSIRNLAQQHSHALAGAAIGGLTGAASGASGQDGSAGRAVTHGLAGALTGGLLGEGAGIAHHVGQFGHPSDALSKRVGDAVSNRWANAQGNLGNIAKALKEPPTGP